MKAYIKALQEALTGLGWEPGAADGIFGPKTARAAAGFAAATANGGRAAPAIAPEPQSPSGGVASASQRRIALVVGHTATQPGAVRVTDGVSEYLFNSALAREVQSYLKNAGHACIVISRQAGLGYTSQIKKAYKEADEWAATATVELHFNSAADPSASGTETLTSGSAKSRELAEEINNRMVAALGLKNRGLIVRGRSDRGGESLFAGSAPAALIEPYFGSNPRDCAAADGNRAALVAAVAEGALVV